MDFKIGDIVELSDNTETHCIGHKFTINNIVELPPELQIVVGDRSYICKPDKGDMQALYIRNIKPYDAETKKDPASLKGHKVMIVNNTRRDRHRIPMGTVGTITNVSPYNEYGGPGSHTFCFKYNGTGRSSTSTIYVNREDFWTIEQFNTAQGTTLTEFPGEETATLVEPSPESRIPNLGEMIPESWYSGINVNSDGGIYIDMNQIAATDREIRQAEVERDLLNRRGIAAAPRPRHRIAIGTRVRIVDSGQSDRWCHEIAVGSIATIIGYNETEPGLYHISGFREDGIETDQILRSAWFNVVADAPGDVGF